MTGKFPKGIEIPLAKWVDHLMDWVIAHWGAFFDSLGDTLLDGLLVVERIFTWLPWYVMIVLVGLLAWRALGRWWHGVLMAGLLFLVGTFGYWKLAMMTLSLVTSSVIISLAIGIPLGILMARNSLIQSIFRPMLDAMQTMPSFVYLIPALMLFGLEGFPRSLRRSSTPCPRSFG